MKLKSKYANDLANHLHNKYGDVRFLQPLILKISDQAKEELVKRTKINPEHGS